jgi:hypothetical protein
LKAIHLTIIASVSAFAIGIFVILMYMQPENKTSDTYAFEGDQKITKNMTVSIDNKSFFVSSLYPQDYVNDTIPFYGVIFSMPGSITTDPSGFVSNLVKFSDGTNESLTTGFGGHPPNTVTVLTRHENPQGGLIRYSNGSVNFLVNMPTLTVDKLKEFYGIGEKIDFAISYQGPIHYCQYPSISVLDSNQNVVWKSREVTSFCISGFGKSLPYEHQEFNISQYWGPIVINTAGRYTVLVSFSDLAVTKEFAVQ